MIGQRLYRARKAAGLSLRDLGARVGLTHAAIKKYEDEQATPPSTTLLKLARALNVRTEYFFRRKRSRSTESSIASAALCPRSGLKRSSTK